MKLFSHKNNVGWCNLDDETLNECIYGAHHILMLHEHLERVEFRFNGVLLKVYRDTSLAEYREAYYEGLRK